MPNDFTDTPPAPQVNVADLVADTILSLPDEKSRRETAGAFIAYGLGLLAAMDGDKAAAMVGYRLSDALAARGGK